MKAPTKRPGRASLSSGRKNPSPRRSVSAPSSSRSMSRTRKPRRRRALERAHGSLPGPEKRC
eukprot:8085736-Lingulodinium_polyedra.AAC.1